MKTYATVTLDGTSKKISDLVSESATQCFEILIQAPLTNISEVYFGTLGNVNHFVAPGGAATPALQNMKDMYIQGSAGDQVIISKFSR